MTTVYARLQVRRDTSANWEAENPILEEGEIGFATDAKAEKIGDGVTPWNNLLSRPSQEQLLAVQAAAEIAAGDAQQRLTATVAAQAATETARDETQTLRDQTYTYKQDVASAIVYQDLASIAEQKAINMVAGFVYDTRLDTDGGAWRDRCQAKSWYNEALNTATRGARRDFPTVAVIIADATSVTIFDGDDPRLPMWMVFNGSWSYAAGSMLIVAGRTEAPITCVTMRNAELVIGSTNSSNVSGVHRINMLSERCICHNGAIRGVTNHPNISQRNANLGAVTGQNLVPSLSSNLTNDLTSLVYPSAPVDPATGLQVPTIFAGVGSAGNANGGTSIIHDDGTVTNVIANTGAGGYACYYLTERFDGGLITSQAFNKSYAYVHIFDSIPDANISASPNPTGSRSYKFSDPVMNLRGQVSGGVPNLAGIADLHGDIAFGWSDKLSFLREDRSDQNKGLFAYLTSTWTSGWMPGDIRGAFLASTDQTDLVGATVDDSQFTGTGATDGWTLDATATNNGGVDQLDVTTGASANRAAYKTITGLVAGAWYKAQIARVSNGNLSALFAGASGTAYVADGTSELTFQAAATSQNLEIRASGASKNIIIDSVKVERADADRSVKNNGLIVENTVTRTPVATGAELVGYTGTLGRDWGGDFTGANTWSMTLWSYGLTGRNLFRWYETADASGANLLQGYVTGTDHFSLTWQNRVAIFADVGPVISGGWHLFNITFDNGLVSLFVDGKFVLSKTINVTQGLYYLRFGDGAGGKQSLARISATIPSAAQITKIYRDEKRLFQPGAQCTLYGTSDAVTALAHDPVTGLLHAGTSAGRSDFDGLARVGNTTTPVASAIAASGGMILEG